MFCQTNAINKCLAGKAGLLGKTDIESLQVDMLCETRAETLKKVFHGAFPTVVKEFPLATERKLPISLAGKK